MPARGRRWAVARSCRGHGDTAGRAYHFRRSWIRNSLKASPSQLRIMHVEGDSMAPTLLDGDTVLVDMTRRAPNPPGIFVLDDGMGLVAKRLEHIANSDPPAVRVISDNKHYPEYERTADEIHIVGRIRWFAREIAVAVAEIDDLFERRALHSGCHEGRRTKWILRRRRHHLWKGLARRAQDTRRKPCAIKGAGLVIEFARERPYRPTGQDASCRTRISRNPAITR